MQSSRIFTACVSAFLWPALLLTQFGCTRKASESATVSIELSRSIPAHGKVDALDASSVLTHLAVNVSGTGISPTKFVEADARHVAGVATALNPSISLEVPAGSSRLIQVLAVYENSTTHQTTIKYGDVTKSLTGGANEVSISVTEIISGFKSARLSGRFLTGTTPFDYGPTGRLTVSFPVGNGRPDMIVQRGEIVNGWFSTFAANVGLKYATESGQVLFDSLNVTSLTGTNFSPGGDNYLYVSAPSEIYTLDDSAVWRIDESKDIVTGFFAPEGQSSLLTGHIACRGYSGTVLDVASDNTGTSVSYDPAGLGTGYRGFNGHNSATSECDYGGPIGMDRFKDKTMYFSTHNMQRASGDSAGGQKGLFSLISGQMDVGYMAGPFLEVTSGDNHTCAITTAGGLSCWGSNGQGQLGDGTYTNSTTPVVVSGTSYQTVSAGGTHTCTVTAAGELKCWGSNTYGQLGDNTTTASNSPISIAFSFKKVFAGTNHTCGITTGDVLKCWGANFQGQIGDGTTVDKLIPTEIDPGVTYSFVAPGDYSSCGITTAGVLKCWGDNVGGQLGDGTVTDRLTPVIVDPGVTYSKVYMAYVHACGITTTGVLKCWGNGANGRLGTGSLTSQLTPVAVNSSATYVAAGLSQLSGCAITSTGRMHCWGRGGIGRFDQGADEIATPADMYGNLYSLSTFHLRSQTGCGLQSGGSLLCFGANTSNQLGLPTASPSTLGTYRKFSAGGVAAAILRVLPGIMNGDAYGGSHFDGVKIYKKDGASNDSIENVDCSEGALNAAGYGLQSYTVTLEPLTRTILVGFGSTFPVGSPGFVLCPTKAGQPVLGGVWFN